MSDVRPWTGSLAMHLRATPVMRPGVPHRLGQMLGDMQAELTKLVDAGEL